MSGDSAPTSEAAAEAADEARFLVLEGHRVDGHASRRRIRTKRRTTSSA
jgi:hypothetical protein